VSILQFFKNIGASALEILASQMMRLRLQRTFPTCRFYPGISVDRASSLGKYIVLFRNTVVINSSIGDHTFIQENSLIHTADIGKFCSIAMGVNVGMGQHPIEHVSTHPAFYSKTQPVAKTFCKEDLFSPFQKTQVGHDVWIGRNAMIKDGVTIGTGAVVAAGAVVTHDVPEYAVVAGVPAKVVKYRFNEEMRKKLIESAWWDKPEQWLQAHASLFSDPAQFLKSCCTK
jgi:acetyltransferase-like isoleucine patch superfamily enzyme